MPSVLFMRMLIESLDRRFAALEVQLRELISRLPEDKLFNKPVSDDRTLIDFSVGGCVIRSAAMIEQVFLGLTRRLWDDPFEWTLPEKLNSPTAIIDYLGEVGEARVNGMAFLKSDADLSRQLPAPEKLRPIFDVLVEALVRAEHYHGRAAAICRIVTEQKH